MGIREDKREKYYCKNGEIVYIKPCKDNKSINILYKGKEYKRDRSWIGTEFFEQDPTIAHKDLPTVHVGDIVKIHDMQEKEDLIIQLQEPTIEYKFTRMGGAYYKAKTEIVESSDGGKILDDGTMIISIKSPLGKSLLNSKVGSTISYPMGNEILSYQVVYAIPTDQSTESTYDELLRTQIIKPKKRKHKKTEQSIKHGTYRDYELRYPEHLIISHEGCFYSCHNESAEVLSEAMGYKLGMDYYGNYVTGGPDIDKILDVINYLNYSYIVIDDGDIVDSYDGISPF